MKPPGGYLKRTGLARTPFPAPLADPPRRPGQQWNSSLARHAWLGAGRAGLAVVDGAGAPVITLPRRSKAMTASTIPPDVLALVDARDDHFCVRCGRQREVIEHHHRRIKGTGSDTRPHTECPCCIVSLCPWWAEPGCHRWAHLNRTEAEAEGLIIPRSALYPFLLSVLVHERDDAGGLMAWPLCDGTWSTVDPDGGAA